MYFSTESFLEKAKFESKMNESKKAKMNEQNSRLFTKIESAVL